MKSIRWGNWLKVFALVAIAYSVTTYIGINRLIMFSEVSIFDGSTRRSFFYYPPSRFFGEAMVFPAILIISSGVWIILSFKATFGHRFFLSLGWFSYSKPSIWQELGEWMCGDLMSVDHCRSKIISTELLRLRVSDHLITPVIY